MTLPTVSRPYSLGPYSLETPAGRYWFPSTFRASHLIPGKAQEEMASGEDQEVWQRLGDTHRVPETLTLTGSLIAFTNREGLRQDVRDLRHALAAASLLVRNNGDGTTREITIDGGLVTIHASGLHHYRATATIYPTSETISTGVEVTPPTLHNLAAEDGSLLTTEHGDHILAIS